MAAFGDDVVTVVQALGLGEVVLIGHSMVLTPLREDFVTAAQQLVRRMFPPGADAEPVDHTFNRLLAEAIEGFKG
jgi:hypothetical protein